MPKKHSTEQARVSFTVVPLPTDGTCGHAGMGNLQFPSPDGKYVIEAPYESEPPHGDSFHLAFVDGIRFPGFFWGSNFAWSPDSQYFLANWMAAYIDRKTVVIDVKTKRYFILPDYFHNFRICFPVIHELGGHEYVGGRTFTFDGSEAWQGYN